MDAGLISALFEITGNEELIVNEKALQSAVNTNGSASASPGGLLGRAVLWGD